MFNQSPLAGAMSMNMSSDVHEFISSDLLLADECSQFYHDPLGWVNWAFDWNHGELEGFEGPDEWQCDWLTEVGRMVTDNNFNGVDPVKAVRMATASGHGIGKSALTSWVILWIMSTRPYAKGIVTANTGEQLRTKTWSELAKWRTRCITGHWFELNSGKGSMSMYHKSWPESWRVDAQTCREENSESFAGLHAANSTPFYLFDEASAIPDKIWEVAEGGLTDGEPMFFCFGNPTRNTGAFRKCFFNRHTWNCKQIDSRTAKMTNKLLIKDWERDWGEDSDFFRVRVKGQFPRAGDMQFIPGDDVLAAMKRTAVYMGDDPLVCGIDIARGGDDNCMIMFRRGKDAKSEKTYRIPGEKSRDSMKVVSMLTMILDRHKPDRCFIDETGIGGPLGDRLRQLGYPVTDVGFGHVADDEKKYANKVSEMGYRCREWIMNGGCIPDEPQLEVELTVREYGHDAKDRLLVESKKLLKKRLGCSPDWADALYLTFAHAVAPRNRVNEDKSHMQRNAKKEYDPLHNM